MITKIKPRNLYWGKWSHYVRVSNPFFRFLDVRNRFKKNQWFVDDSWIDNRALISREIIYERHNGLIEYDVIEFKDFIKIMRKYCQQHGNIEKFRFENRYCTMYTNSDKLEQTLTNKLINIIDGVARPVNSIHEQMMRESAINFKGRFKDRIVSKLPKHGYQYKINVHSMHTLINKYPNLAEVLLDYDRENLCLLPDRCKSALKDNDKCIWYTHMYVKDEDTLNLILLILDHSHIGEIEVFKTF